MPLPTNVVNTHKILRNGYAVYASQNIIDISKVSKGKIEYLHNFYYNDMT